MGKPAPATKTERRMYPDADPTAPGGMSQAELRIELAEYHGVSMDQSREMSWTEQIEAVCQGRLDREGEQGIGPRAKRESVPAPAGRKVPAKQVESFPIQVQPSEPEDGTCQHGEDPDLCEACEAILMGEEEDPEDDPAEVEAQQVMAEHEGESVGAVEEALVDAGLDPDDYPDLPEPVTPDFDVLDEEGNVVIPEPEPEVSEKAEPEFFAPTEEDIEDPEAWFAEAETERDDHVAALPPALFLGMPGVLDYSFSGHAGTGPSQAERWMVCTASLGASRRFLERLSINQQHEFANANVAARQGTTAHAAAEVEARVMLGELDANQAEHALMELAINPPAGEDYTPEMAEFITEYTDLIQMYLNDGHEVLIEARMLAAIPLTAPLPKEAWADPDDSDSAMYYVIPGSVDCGVMPTEDEMVLTAVDLKYGEGKDVDPDSNPQVRIYMLGLLMEFIEKGGDIDTLERLDYVIAQPRLGGIKRWTESVNDLLTWRDEVLSPALTAALGLAPAEYVPGDLQCQWCPARGGCSALAAARVEAATELFTALDDAEFHGGPGVVAADLDNERLGELLTQITGLIDLQKDLKAEAQRRVYRGDTVPGWMLVNYTPPRSWKPNAAEVLEEIPEAWTEPALKSPTQFLGEMASEFKGKNKKEREAQAQEKFKAIIEVPEKRPVVAPEGDRRSKWQGVAPDVMFPDLGDDE